MFVGERSIDRYGPYPREENRLYETTLAAFSHLPRWKDPLRSALSAGVTESYSQLDAGTPALLGLLFKGGGHASFQRRRSCKSGPNCPGLIPTTLRKTSFTMSMTLLRFFFGRGCPAVKTQRRRCGWTTCFTCGWKAFSSASFYKRFIGSCSIGLALAWWFENEFRHMWFPNVSGAGLGRW